MVAGFDITSNYIDNMFGVHKFVTIFGRHYTLERCVAAPLQSKTDLLRLASCLAKAALARRGGGRGAVLIFLPGLPEIRTVEAMIHSCPSEPLVSILHSNVIGQDDQDENFLTAAISSNYVILSTAVRARSMPFPNVKYVIIHPYTRTQVMGVAGLHHYLDVPVSAGLRENMQGRAGRTMRGLATFLFDFDDSSAAFEAEQRSSASRSADGTAPDSSAGALEVLALDLRRS